MLHLHFLLVSFKHVERSGENFGFFYVYFFCFWETPMVTKQACLGIREGIASDGKKKSFLEESSKRRDVLPLCLPPVLRSPALDRQPRVPRVPEVVPGDRPGVPPGTPRPSPTVARRQRHVQPPGVPFPRRNSCLYQVAMQLLLLENMLMFAAYINHVP